MSTTRLVVGKEALIGRVGADLVREAEAWQKYEGQRTTRRATWDTYCYPVAGATGPDFIVASVTEMAVRKSQYMMLPAAEAAAEWAGSGGPVSPSVAAFSLADLPPMPDGAVLSLDTEGRNGIERASLAWDTVAGTFAWDPLGRAFVRDAVARCGLLLIYNAAYDVPLLEAEGIRVDRAKVRDLMIAHCVLNPWRERGLGKAAPLYIPVYPWKGSSDPEYYSLYDAWVPLRMWPRMLDLLTERRLHSTCDREHAMMWRLAAAGLKPKPTWYGKETPITKAAGLLEG